MWWNCIKWWNAFKTNHSGAGLDTVHSKYFIILFKCSAALSFLFCFFLILNNLWRLRCLKAFKEIYPVWGSDAAHVNCKLDINYRSSSGLVKPETFEDASLHHYCHCCSLHSDIQWIYQPLATIWLPRKFLWGISW